MTAHSPDHAERAGVSRGQRKARGAQRWLSVLVLLSGLCTAFGRADARDTNVMMMVVFYAAILVIDAMRALQNDEGKGVGDG